MKSGQNNHMQHLYLSEVPSQQVKDVPKQRIMSTAQTLHINKLSLTLKETTRITESSPT